MAGPTVYGDLNALLVDFVGRVRTILEDNFCGAYLQGSFAVGDADEHSDVDFIVATHAAAGSRRPLRSSQRSPGSHPSRYLTHLDRGSPACAFAYASAELVVSCSTLAP
jgi:hypothetical protein